MKGFFISIVLFFLSSDAKAQTLEETKSWILSKLNKYQTEIFGIKLKGDCDSYNQSYNFHSTFKKDTLVISFDNKTIFPDCFMGNRERVEKETAQKAVVKIPISDITEISASDYGSKFYINTKLETIRFIATFVTGNNETFTDVCQIGMNVKTENELLERMQKAFKRLVSFYPKKKNKEAF